MNANVGYCLKCGATQGNHYSPECLPGFATTDPVKYYAVVMQQDYDALAAQMAEMRQAMDELHVKHGRSMRGIEQLEARLAEASALISSQGIRLMEADDVAARLAEAERDAQRYRFLRDQDGMGNIFMHTPTCDLDATIDREIAADSATVVQYKPCEICTTQSWCETHGCQCYPVSAVQPERCCLDYPRCDCNSPPEPDNAPALQPCGHPWKAQHDSKCILCSSPGVTP